MTAPTTSELFAATAPGLESIALGELKRHGVKGKAEPGGVSYRGDAKTLYSTSLWLRTASRIVVRIARFHASTFHELERRAKQVPWADYLPASATVRLRVTCRKSRLYHSDAVGQRILGVIAKVAPGITVAEGQSLEGDPDHEASADAESGTMAQLFIVRIVDDQCEISADTSGELLHRRGYRQEVGKAPLRETLAAAMVLASGWRAPESLIDPLCGSGTIPVEAALLARGIAPGIGRKFAFMNWPAFDETVWDRVHADARAASWEGSGLEIIGADRDSGGIDAARRNAERAGVAHDIRFVTQALSATLEELEGERRPGWVLTNPPYGVRVGDTYGLRNLYATLGSKVKSTADWRLGILTSDAALSRQMGLPMRARFSTSNGGIPVAFVAQERLLAAKVPLRNRGVKGKIDGR